MTASGFNHPYLTLLLLIACFVVTLFVSMKLRREVDEDAKPTTPKELFGPLERAYHAGLMREDEYLRIRDQMERAKAEAASAKAKPPVAKKPAGPADEWASWDAPGQ